jgi:ubiquinone/menaquinone biosynthesis methyltransferase
MQNPERTQFGEQTVTPEEKTNLVHGVFDSVATKYDIMNDLMSGGLHRLWKDRLIRMIRPRPNQKFLDVAGGTGDIAFRLKKRIGPKANITVCDLTAAMLEVGRDRATDKGWIDGFEWITGNAEDLPFPDNHFDIYTIAFGLRNVTHIDKALKEAHRVLKPGGKFYCLEFSHVETPILSKAYDLYSFNVIPKVGKAVTNDEESYQYLVESIRKFPTARKLESRMQDAGFTKTNHTKMNAGIVAIHQGLKA